MERAPAMTKCHRCATENPPRAKFCLECGTPLPAPEDLPAPTAGPGAPSGPPGWQQADRRQLTLLFCDIVESTSLSARLDPEDYRDVVRAYQETCAAAIARYDGHVAQYLGDGILAYFGYPIAHEGDAQRAVRA